MKYIRFKDLFRVVSKKNNSKDIVLLAATQDRGIIPKSDVGYRTVTISEDNYEGLKLVNVGDFCITLRSFQGGIEYSEYKGGISSGYTVLRLKKIAIEKYFKYFLKNVHFVSTLNKYKVSIRDGQNIPFSSLGKENILLLEYEVQQKIANFLDIETAKIDKEIELLEKKVELLNEYQQSLVFETVTKGLDKNVKMKDSGIDWIGEIPEHWEIKRVKENYVLGMGQTILKDDLIENGNFPIYSATAEDKYFGYVNNITVTLNEGDMVIPARGNSIGHVKLVKRRSSCTQTTIYMKKKNKICSDFVRFFLLGHKNEIFKFDDTAIPQVTVAQIRSKTLLSPPIEEQKNISEYLNKAEFDNNKKTELINKKISLLKEYKQSLIYEAVTGKLEIN